MRQIKRIVLLSGNWDPYLKELTEQLEWKGFEVLYLNIFAFKIYQTHIGHNYTLKSHFLRRLCNNRFTPLKLKYGVMKKILRKYLRQEDIVEIHFCSPEYVDFIPVFQVLGCRVISHLWGSDLLRTTKQTKELQKKLFQYSRNIVCETTVKDSFISYFPEYESKLKLVNFGIKKLDMIHVLHDKKELREKYLIPNNKIVITCGYNGNLAQQHILMSHGINLLSNELKDKIYLVFPMTYGGNNDYHKQVEKYVNSIGVDCLFIYKLNEANVNNEIAGIRMLSDIVVNFQTTDALSASLLESLKAGNVLILGDWLYYSLYEEYNIYYLKVAKDLLTAKLEDVIEHLDDYKLLSEKNSCIVQSFATWTNNINTSVDLYQSVAQ